MAHIFQFDSNKQHGMCEQCEAMLADALDGTLSAADQALFDGHIAHCAACSAMLADAQRGAAWLEMLKTPRPEPPVALLERILAQTSGQPGVMPGMIPGVMDTADRAVAPAFGNVIPLPPVYGLPAQPQVFAAGRVLAFPQRGGLRHIVNVMMQPRLAMTAAMAFFSIALTMNLTGVRVRDLNAETLSPAGLTRAFYATNTRVVQYYQGLRVVNELEARVNDLRSDSDGSASAGSTSESSKPRTEQPSEPQQEKPAPSPAPGPGTSKRETPDGTLRMVAGGYDLKEPSIGPADSSTQEVRV